jgi:hypothetical protein
MHLRQFVFFSALIVSIMAIPAPEAGLQLAARQNIQYDESNAHCTITCGDTPGSSGTAPDPNDCYILASAIQGDNSAYNTICSCKFG